MTTFPIVDLDKNTVTNSEGFVTLSPTEAEIAFVVLAAAPKSVAFADLYAKVYGDGSDGPVNLYSIASTMRKKLAAINVAIVNEYGYGYRYAPDGKAAYQT